MFWTAFRNQKPRFFWIGIFAIICGKLLLVGKEEIISAFAPHDDLWHIRSALRWYWQGAYDGFSLIHLPLYSLFIRVVSETGMPLRIVTECAYLLSGVGLAWVLHKIGYSIITSILGFAAIAFHPATIPLFNRTGAEILMVPALLGAISASIWWLHQRAAPGDIRRAIFAGLLWMTCWNLRKESILIIGILFVFATGIVLVEKKTAAPQLLRRLFLGVFIPLLFSIGLNLAVKTANYFRWGVFQTSILTSPGYKAAFKALQSVPPQVVLPFIPVPAEVRERVYAVSPAFAELKNFFDGSSTPFGPFSREFTDAKGLTWLGPREIAAGWFYWALHDGCIQVGHGNNPVEEDRFFQSIADEISHAQKRGLLGKRLVPMAYIDPAWSLWIRRYPDSLAKIFQTSTDFSRFERMIESPAEALRCGQEFNEMVNRRPHLLELTQSDQFILSGVVYTNGDKLLKIFFTGDKAPIEGNENISLENNKWKFQISSYLLNKVAKKNARVHFVFENGGEFSLPLRKFSNPKGKHFAAINFSADVQHFAISETSKPTPRSWKLQKKISPMYFRVLRFGGYLFFLLPVISVWAIYRKQWSLRWWTVLFMSFILFERYAFFAVLDASSWSGDQPRYLLPAMPLQSILIVLISAEVFSMLRSLISHLQNRPHHELLA